jgi:hypothetical protein
MESEIPLTFPEYPVTENHPKLTESHLCLDLPNGILPLRFMTKIVYIFVFLPGNATYCFHRILLCSINSIIDEFFFLIRIVVGGVQTGSIRHDGHWMAYCTCPGWLRSWRIWWNKDWQWKPKYSEKTYPSTTLSTTNPTWPDPGWNPGRRGGKTATNRLSYGAVIIID